MAHEQVPNPKQKGEPEVDQTASAAKFGSGSGG
jgi:hypothetical protein